MNPMVLFQTVDRRSPLVTYFLFCCCDTINVAMTKASPGRKGFFWLTVPVSSPSRQGSHSSGSWRAGHVTATIKSREQ